MDSRDRASGCAEPSTLELDGRLRLLLLTLAVIAE